MEDPIHKLCIVPPVPVNDNFLDAFSLSDTDYNSLIQQLPSITFTTGSDDPDIKYTNVTKYAELQTLKNIYSSKESRDYIPLVYPYEDANNSIFMNRCGLKLANLDKIFMLTGHVSGAVNKQLSKEAVYCDLAGGPGGFIQYLQYRNPVSITYGITYKKAINYNMNKLDIKRFVPIYGRDSTGDGNLYNEWQFFIETLKIAEPYGVDLVTADGGIDVEGQEHRQEFLNVRLIAVEILVGISVCKEDSPFIFKIYDSVLDTTVFLLLICALAFKEIHIFKPVTSRWTNSERYVACLHRRPSDSNMDIVIDTLKKIVTSQTDTTRITSVQGLKIPKVFENWITKKNSESIDLQYKIATQMTELMSESTPEIPNVNLHQLLIVLDLPGERYK